MNTLVWIIHQIKNVIPVIMSLEDVDEAIINTSSLPLIILGLDLTNVLLRNFVHDKTQHFINNYTKVISNYDMGTIESILEYAIKKQKIKS